VTRSVLALAVEYADSVAADVRDPDCVYVGSVRIAAYGTALDRERRVSHARGVLRALADLADVSGTKAVLRHLKHWESSEKRLPDDVRCLPLYSFPAEQLVSTPAVQVWASSEDVE